MIYSYYTRVATLVRITAFFGLNCAGSQYPKLEQVLVRLQGYLVKQLLAMVVLTSLTILLQGIVKTFSIAGPLWTFDILKHNIISSLGK